jgi:ribonuclease HI
MMITNTTDQKLQEVIEDIRKYNIAINDHQPVDLFTDGLCENPGAMHIGLFARQGSSCLFTRHMFVGHGTCNEAEYIAVKAGLCILQALYPEPKVPVNVHCDSQLVTKQVNGLWKTSGKMQTYCAFLRKLRHAYPYELKKIPRDQNEMADSLAQKYILKNSGRCMTIEQGRFNVLKQVPATVKRADTYNAVTSQEFREYLSRNNLNGDLRQLLQLAADGRKEQAIALSHSIRGKAETILKSAPKTNDLVAQWVANTVSLVQRSVDQIVDSLHGNDAPNLQYIVEELAGEENPQSDLYLSQIGMLREGYQAESPASDDSNEGDDF